jgi:general secretion pathway protein C
MRLALDPRARRLLRRLPRTTVYSALEIALLSLLAIQCARLAWTIVTPVGPVGDWRTQSALRPLLPGSSALLGGFDPFFRLSESSGPAVVTSLDLKLYGVREDRASGRGSAIIATPDGVQRSFAVGEEIVPGVTLTAVSFDSVAISRGGVTEQLFLDQSAAAPVVAPPPPMIGVPAVQVAPPPPPPVSEIRVQPRVSDGRVTGVAVYPQGSGEAFRAAGLAPGDVIVSVNGERIGSAEQAQAIASRIGDGEVSLEVDRGGRVVPIRVRRGQ